MLSVFRPAREYQIAAAIIASAAFVAYVTTLAYGADARVSAHRLLAHRLWLACERYRALLTEIQDGLIDGAAILQRREALSEHVHTIYEQGFPADQQAFETMRQLPFEGDGEPMTDAQIDQLVPVVRKAG